MFPSERTGASRRRMPPAYYVRLLLEQWYSDICRRHTHFYNGEQWYKVHLPQIYIWEDDEKLIFEVSTREVLYKLSDVDYKNVLKKDKECQKIGEILGKPGDQCKKRWKNIRDNFTRHRKEDCSGTGKAAKRKRANYWEMLSFLDNVEQERKGLTNVDAECNDSEATESSQHLSNIPTDCTDEELNENESLQFDETEQRPPSQQTCKSTNVVKKTTKTRNDVYVGLLKERLEGHQKLVECVEKLAPPKVPIPENDVDLFFKTMAATVNKFTPQQIAQVRMQIFNIVSNIELSNYSNAQKHSTTDGNSRSPSKFSHQSNSYQSCSTTEEENDKDYWLLNL